MRLILTPPLQRSFHVVPPSGGGASLHTTASNPQTDRAPSTRVHPEECFFITTRKLDLLFCRENPISVVKELKMICCGGQYFISNLTSTLSNTSIVGLLTEVVCNLLVEHNVLGITRLRRARRPQIFNGKLLI